jgi:hypothetical protein
MVGGELVMRKYDNLSVTNGKEALEKIKYLTLNEPSGYGVYSTQLKDTIHYFIIKKELDELAKYKRAFEILKDKFHLDIIENGYYDCIDLSYDSVNPDNLPKEEYELLEELLKS